MPSSRTQLHPGATTGQPYGSFAKPVRSEPVITQLHAGAIIGMRYGSFNKTVTPPPLTPQQISTALYGASGTSGGYIIPQQFGWRRKKKKFSVVVDDDFYLVEQLC